MNCYAIVVKRNWRNYFRISSCQINKGKNRLTNPMSRGKKVNKFDEKGIKVFCCLFSLPKKIICEGTKRKVLWVIAKIYYTNNIFSQTCYIIFSNSWILEFLDLWTLLIFTYVVDSFTFIPIWLLSIGKISLRIVKNYFIKFYLMFHRFLVSFFFTHRQI